MLLGALLAGCSGGGSNTGGGYACPALSVSDPGATLVAPARGATGVSTTVGTLTFTVTNPTLRSGTVTLSVKGQNTSIQGGPIATDANGLSSSSVPVLQPHTTYEARVRSTTVDQKTFCPSSADGDLGSFTTQ